MPKRLDVVIVKSWYTLPTFQKILSTVVNTVAKHLDSDPESIEFTIFKAYAGGGIPRTHIMFNIPEDVEVDPVEIKAELIKEFADEGLEPKWVNAVKVKEIEKNGE